MRTSVRKMKTGLPDYGISDSRLRLKSPSVSSITKSVSALQGLHYRGRIIGAALQGLRNME